jgi:hypothetical protein
VAAERAAWKASQPEIDIQRLVFIDETGASFLSSFAAINAASVRLRAPRACSRAAV